MSSVSMLQRSTWANIQINSDSILGIAERRGYTLPPAVSKNAAIVKRLRDLMLAPAPTLPTLPSKVADLDAVVTAHAEALIRHERQRDVCDELLAVAYQQSVRLAAEAAPTFLPLICKDFDVAVERLRNELDGLPLDVSPNESPAVYTRRYNAAEALEDAGSLASDWRRCAAAMGASISGRNALVVLVDPPTVPDDNNDWVRTWRTVSAAIEAFKTGDHANRWHTAINSGATISLCKSADELNARAERAFALESASASLNRVYFE